MEAFAVSFQDPDIANQVVDELVKIGCDAHEIFIFHLKGENDPEEKEAEKELRNRDFPEDEVKSHLQAIRDGETLLVLSVEDKLADDVDLVFDEYEAEQDVATKKREQGAEQAQGERREESIPVIQEELKVGKRRTSGAVRAQQVVTEKPVEERVPLKEEKVEVERQPEDRKLERGEQEQAFKEKTIELPETKEEPVVSKEAHVVEQVKLQQKPEERQETVRENVRRSDVKVEREPEKEKAEKGGGKKP